ncbi:MAG: hypothetical protein AABW51_04310 [Nanoarchaeota archaeon]
MGWNWKNWNTYFLLILILFSVYSFIKVILIIIQALSYDPNDISNLGIVVGPTFGLFSLWFVFYAIITILFLVLAFSLWKQKRIGILIGSIPFLGLIYVSINPLLINYVKTLIYIPERFSSEIGSFILILLLTIFYIASFIYLVYTFLHLKNQIENNQTPR